MVKRRRTSQEGSSVHSTAQSPSVHRLLVLQNDGVKAPPESEREKESERALHRHTAKERESKRKPSSLLFCVFLKIQQKGRHSTTHSNFLWTRCIRHNGDAHHCVFALCSRGGVHGEGSQGARAGSFHTRKTSQPTHLAKRRRGRKKKLNLKDGPQRE